MLMNRPDRPRVDSRRRKRNGGPDQLK
jgi:hypothetical protein